MPENYPLPKFHFQVEWGGANLGFTEVSGLDVETAVIEYRDGASPEYVKKKMPGQQTYTNITMKRGTLMVIMISMSGGTLWHSIQSSAVT